MAYIIQNKFPIDTQPDTALGFKIIFNGDAIFVPTYTTKDQLKQNLINWFLTNRGERYMNPNFGADLREVIFEGIIEEDLNLLKQRLQNEVNVLFPAVKIMELKILQNEDQNQIRIELTYNVINFGIEDQIELTLQ